MGTIGWLALIAVGIALGIGIGRALPVRNAKMAALEREKEQARNELGTYREEVSAHFERTAALFDKVTADYRSLYEHLALSARQLGAIEGESSKRPLEEPEQRRLGPSQAPDAVDNPEPPASPETSEASETSGTSKTPGTAAAAETAEEPETQETPDTADEPVATSARRGDS